MDGPGSLGMRCDGVEVRPVEVFGESFDGSSFVERRRVKMVNLFAMDDGRILLGEVDYLVSSCEFYELLLVSYRVCEVN